jgi:serine protease Do
VGEVYPNTPASKSGLQTDDVVVSFDGQDIQSADEFIRMVGGYRSGDSASMVVLRNGKKRTLSVTLGARPSEKDLAFGTFNQNTLSDNGILVADASGLNLAEQDEGVVVLQITSKNALTKALRVGDVVFKVNDTLIRNAQSFYAATQEVSSIESVTIFRNGEVQTLRP